MKKSLKQFKLLNCYTTKSYEYNNYSNMTLSQTPIYMFVIYIYIDVKKVDWDVISQAPNHKSTGDI